MIGNDEVFIDEDFIENYNNKKTILTKEEQINIENELNDNDDGIEKNKDNQNKEMQEKSEEEINFDNINENETDNINITNNNNNTDINNAMINQIPLTEKEGENGENKQIYTQKESATHRYSTNLMDDISVIPTTKEESVQPKLELNIHNKLTNFNNEQNYNFQSEEINKKIMEQSEESKIVDNMINKDLFDNQRVSNNYNSIFNNNKNKLYFTETDVPGNKKGHRIKKSNSSLSYLVGPSPENNQGFLLKTPSKLYIRQKESEIQKKLRKELNTKLNNLSPEEYMKKKYVNKFNFHPLQYRIKKIEEEIEKQNQYDFDRAMKEYQIKYDKELKCKEKKKFFFELHKQLDEKLRNMEEKRENLYNEKIQKIIQKQKETKSNKRRKNFNKSCENNNSNCNIKSNITNTNKITDIINSYLSANEKSGKLPLIKSLPKHELIKIMKEKKETEFCNNTIKKLKESEIIHRKNYLKRLGILNSKFIQNNKIYKERSAKCLIATKSRDSELEEDYIEKDMIKRYNIKQILLREKTEKNDKIKETIKKNIEGVKEKKEIIERKEKEKIKKIIKHLNREFNKNNVNEHNDHGLREYYSSLQKENLKKNNKDFNDYYNELILRQEDNVVIANELEKAGAKIKQAILKKSLKEQNKKNKQLKIMEIHLSKMERENINNKDEDTRRKIIEEKRRIEFEKLEKEMEKKEMGKI